MNLSIFLEEGPYIDFTSPTIVKKAKELFEGIPNDSSRTAEKARIAYEYVRDRIPHSFDINATVITAKASDVLKYKTGICHAKANLLAALLRSQEIPAGMCFQHLTLSNDDSLGYCVHCYNAVYVDEHWIRLDARGNTNGINARFSLKEPILAFPKRKEYDEYDWPGIYATPHLETMLMLTAATCKQDIIDKIPDTLNKVPNISE